MKKISYFKLLLSLMLVCTSLVGCLPNSKSTNSKDNQLISGRTTDSKQLDKITIEAAYNNFKNAETKFIENLKAAVKNEQVRQSIKSDTVNQSLGILKKTIATFQAEELPKIDQNKKASVTTILNDINTSLDEISTKAIDPLKDGLTKGSVEKVQRNLDFFKQNGIPEDQYGHYGEITYEKIKEFLQAKNAELDAKLKGINQNLGTLIDPADFQKISNRVNSLEKENQRLKTPYTPAFWIALIAILISVFKDIGIKYIGRFFINQPDIEKEENSDNNITHGSKNLDYNEISNQVYKRISQKISSKISETSEEKIGNFVKQIDKKINSITSDLEYQIDQLRRTINQTKSSYNSPPPAYTPPVVSTPQVSNFSTSQWINTYNNNPGSLSRNVTEVSPTEESLSNRRLGSSQTVILATKRRGNYWILTEGSSDYLVPSQSLRINQHNYKTVEALFECRNYHPDSSENFKLVKPAVVYPLSGGQTWQLQQPGILQF